MGNPGNHARLGQGRLFNYVDLFCGCGGFSLGLKRTGLNCVAAIDSDPTAIRTYKQNFPHVKHVLEQDLTTFTAENLRALIGQVKVDLIVGGPPCQGFSKVRKVDGSNHGSRLVKDPRRLLYRNYLHFVEYFRPSMFVMENVPGIRSTAKGEFFISMQAEARKLGYRVHASTIRAWEHGVPQKRERQLIIGTSCDLAIFSTNIHIPPTHKGIDDDTSDRQTGARRARHGAVTLWEAIGDLPPLRAGEGSVEMVYDFERRQEHIRTRGSHYLMSVLQVCKAKNLTGHSARTHSARDLRDFARLREGETSLQAIARGEKMEFPYDRGSFKDRYTRQHRNRLCSTIVAHLSKDGLMFIHPTQQRSLTVREAARVQSFPDWFVFPAARTAAFRLVGNAVPPRLAEAIGTGIKRYLSASRPTRELKPMPASASEAVKWLAPAMGTTSSRILRALPLHVLKKAWFSIGFLNIWLHPDGAADVAHQVTEELQNFAPLTKFAPQIAVPLYASTGWPVQLVPLAKEAARRFQEGKLRSDEYYCSNAQLAGWKWWRSYRGSNGEQAP
jgi:DNA (cytosine-5)-methyltransferase 1